jgi:hypothetical protein
MYTLLRVLLATATISTSAFAAEQPRIGPLQLPASGPLLVRGMGGGGMAGMHGGMGMGGGGTGMRGFTGGGMGGIGMNGGGMGYMGTGMMPSIGSSPGIQSTDCNTSRGGWTLIRPARSGSQRGQCRE